MDQKRRYILMHKDERVLSFEVTFGECYRVEVIEPLEHFERAPFGMKRGMDAEMLNYQLMNFCGTRAIAFQRQDYDDIIKYTGASNAFELSFKGHGLTLANHYWYQKEGESLRYKDINFFENGWDDSFGRAVLKGDYEALKDVDLNVPDIVTAGWGIKGWLYEAGVPRLYKLGICKGHCEEPLAEVLSSRLAQRIFKKGDAAEYELAEIYGKYASVSNAIVGLDEELLPLSFVLPWEINELYRARGSDKTKTKEFFGKLEECSIPGLVEFFVKISCFRSISFVNDLHFDNLSAIRNLETGAIRLAPMLDFGSSFGSGQKARAILSNITKSTYLLVYFMYSDLEPDWDYSWYHKEALIGFEDEIKEMLSKSPFYTPELINNIIDVYHTQLAALNRLAHQ